MSPGRLQARLFSFSVNARIQRPSLAKTGKKQRPWIPDRVGDDRREKTAPQMLSNPGRLSRRGCAPPSFLFLSSLRTRGSSVVLFAKTGKSKDPGSPIESGMTEGRKQRHPWRQIQGACRRGCAAVPNFLWRRGLFERSACPEQREGTLNQKPSAWESRFLPSTGSGQARDPSLRSGQARNDNGAAPEGPRLGAHGFGSFCRNKSIPSRRAGAKPRKHSLSPCGGETPQAFLRSSTPFQTSPTIGMTIPVLAAPRTARRKNKEKSVDFRTCDSYNPHKSFGGFAVSYRSTSFQSSITEKGEEGLT